MNALRQRFEAGTQFRLPPRPMTRERMRWYVDIQDTVYYNDGRIHPQPPTIHDDDDSNCQDIDFGPSAGAPSSC